MKRTAFFICVLALSFVILGTNVYSQTTEDYDYSEIDEFMGEKTKDNATFSEMVEMIVGGDIDSVYTLAGNEFYNIALAEIDSTNGYLGKIIAVTIIGACFSLLSGTFKEGQVSKTSFYMTFAVIAALLFSTVKTAMELSQGAVLDVINFISVLVPLFLTALALSSGSLTGMGFVTIVMTIIDIINVVILKVIIPLCFVYTLIVLLNAVHKDGRLRSMVRLVKSGINFLIKTLYAFVIGINIIKGMILPVADAIKETAFIKAVEAVPVIGDGLSGTTSVVAATSTLIKNGIGVTGMISLLIITFSPSIKLLIIAMYVKIVAAIVEPISDINVVMLINGISDGIFMMLKAVFTAAMLFIITLALICAKSNVNMYMG